MILSDVSQIAESIVNCMFVELTNPMQNQKLDYFVYTVVKLSLAMTKEND